MKPKPILGLTLTVALVPMAWAGSQAAQSQTTASSQSHVLTRGEANLVRREDSAAIHSGTRIPARLLTRLNARKAKPGQRVEAKITQNVKQNGRIVIRKNARLIGHVVSAQARSKGHANSQIQVVFDRLLQGHTPTALNTVVTSIVSVPTAPMPVPMQPAGATYDSPVAGAVFGSGARFGTPGSTIGDAGKEGSAARTAGKGISVTNGLGAIGAAKSGTAGASKRTANVALNSSGQASSQTKATTTFDCRNGNLELNSGTEVQFQVVGSANVRTPSPH